MPFPLLFAFALAQDPAPAPAFDLTTPYEVFEPQRIALTPKIDGRLEEEEWDLLGDAGAGKANLQWEPGALHISATIPEGQDLVASFDLKSDGWLIGGDNVEFRLSGNTVRARILDASRVTGPVWLPVPGFAISSQIASGSVDGQMVVEATLRDPGIGLLPTNNNTTMSVRMDTVPTAEPDVQPYMPRVLTKINLGMQRSAALPTGMKFNIEGVGKSVSPGEWMRLRLTFNGADSMNLNKLGLRGEGAAKEGTYKLEVPFPRFDEKGRAFVDYDTTVAGFVPEGYRVLRAHLSAADGVTSNMQGSYRVAPPVDFELSRDTLRVADRDRTQRFTVQVRSNTGKRMVGDMWIDVPAPLRVVNRDDWEIRLSGNQRTRLQFELFIPANYSGTFPVKFKGALNDTRYDRTGYVTIGG